MLEYMYQVSFVANILHERRWNREFHELRAAGIMFKPRSDGQQVDVVAELPAANLASLRQTVAHLERFLKSEVEARPIGYRSRQAWEARGLIARLGMPADWAGEGVEMPLAGDPFPSFPSAGEPQASREFRF